MADSPLIAILTPAQKQAVARRSLGENRPKVFDASIAELQAQALRNGDANADELNPEAQISADLEAFLILLKTDAKKALLDFIKEAQALSSSADDLELMAEVAEIRRVGYAHVNAEVASPLIGYDRARAGVMETLDTLSEQGGEGATTVVIPQLSLLLGALVKDHTQMSTADILGIHDRITDQMVVDSYQTAGLTKTRELASWASVILAYL